MNSMNTIGDMNVTLTIGLDTNSTEKIDKKITNILAERTYPVEMALSKLLTRQTPC
jgi:hypothetical protein